MATLTLFPFCGSYKNQFSEPRLPHTPGTPGTGPLHVLIQAHFWIRETMQRNLLKQRHENKFKNGLKGSSCPPGGETRTLGKLTGDRSTASSVCHGHCLAKGRGSCLEDSQGWQHSLLSAFYTQQLQKFLQKQNTS